MCLFLILPFSHSKICKGEVNEVELMREEISSLKSKLVILSLVPLHLRFIHLQSELSLAVPVIEESDGANVSEKLHIAEEELRKMIELNRRMETELNDLQKQALVLRSNSQGVFGRLIEYLASFFSSPVTSP